MNEDGFGHLDYDVMENSCNSFTAALSRRILGDLAMCRYPSAVRHQSRLADWLSPVARALDLVQHEDPEQDEKGHGIRGSRWVVGRGSAKIGASIGIGEQVSEVHDRRRRTSF